MGIGSGSRCGDLKHWAIFGLAVLLVAACGSGDAGSSDSSGTSSATEPSPRCTVHATGSDQTPGSPPAVDSDATPIISGSFATSTSYEWTGDDRHDPITTVRMETLPDGNVCVTLIAEDPGDESGVAAIRFRTYDGESQVYSGPFAVASGAEVIVQALDQAGHLELPRTLIVLPGPHDDVQQSIAIDGPSVSVGTTQEGQNARLTFEGVAGQLVSLQVLEPETKSAPARGWIVDPDGFAVSGWERGLGGSSPIGGRLPETGTYTIFVNARDTDHSQVTLQLVEAFDYHGMIRADGTPHEIIFDVPHQRAELQFDGKAGQLFYLVSASSTVGPKDGPWQLYLQVEAPDGTTIGDQGIAVGARHNRTELRLSATGTYRIDLIPQAGYTGEVTLALHDVLAPEVRASVGGPPVTVEIEGHFDQSSVAFEAHTGDWIQLDSNVLVGNSSCCSVLISILEADGRPLKAETWKLENGQPRKILSQRQVFANIGAFQNTRIWFQVPGSGVYIALVQSADDASSEVRLQLSLSTAPSSD